MSNEEVTEQIRSVLLAKAQALTCGNASALAALIHPDFIYVNASGETFDKDGYVNNYCASGQVVFLEQRISELLVRQFEGFAVATLTLNDKFVVSEQSVEGCCQSLCVFSVAGEEWQWAAGQTTAQEQS